MVDHENNKTNFPHKSLLTNRQVSNLRKASANNSSANTKLLKTQLFKTMQSGGFPGRLLGLLLKQPGLTLMKNILKTLATSVLIKSRLTPTASAADAGIDKTYIPTSGFSKSGDKNLFVLCR